VSDDVDGTKSGAVALSAVVGWEDSPCSGDVLEGEMTMFPIIEARRPLAKVPLTETDKSLPDELDWSDGLGWSGAFSMKK
jgi:hypothetical protein